MKLMTEIEEKWLKEIQDLRSKLLASEAGAADLKEALDSLMQSTRMYFGSALPDYYNHAKELYQKTRSSPAGADLLREMEELRKRCAFLEETFSKSVKHLAELDCDNTEIYFELEALKEKLKVAKEAIQEAYVENQNLNCVTSMTPRIGMQALYRQTQIFHKALSLLNETSKDSVGGEEKV